MRNKLDFYALSFVTLVFQFLFLAMIKEYEKEFNLYIQVMAINQILLSFAGSIQFYFEEQEETIKLNFYRSPIILLTIFFLILSLYYLNLDIKWFIFFATSIWSLIFLTINTAFYARFNLFKKNTNLLLIFSLVKFLTLFGSFIFSFDVVMCLIISNLIIILICLKIIRKIKYNFTRQQGYSIKSVINNVLGTGNTTLDKLYCSHYALSLATGYFVIFKVASVFQYLTEIVFREERFIVTEGKNKINSKIVFKKFLLTSFLILALFFFIKNLGYLLDKIEYEKFDILISFFEIIVRYNNQFCIISFAFLINSLAGLIYDKIYRKYGNNFLIYINASNVILFVILLFTFGTSIKNITLIFLIIHLFNYIATILLNIYLEKNLDTYFKK